MSVTYNICLFRNISTLEQSFVINLWTAPISTLEYRDIILQSSSPLATAHASHAYSQPTLNDSEQETTEIYNVTKIQSHINIGLFRNISPNFNHSLYTYSSQFKNSVTCNVNSNSIIMPQPFNPMTWIWH